MSAKTRKEVLVEQPIDRVYDTLIHIFPVKHYRLRDHNDPSHSVEVFDETNQGFIMFISLLENTANTTFVNFTADYPNAVSDIGSGGKKAIYAVLEELLNELDKLPKVEFDNENESKLEISNAQNFENTEKTKPKTLGIIAGYILCALSLILPIIAYTTEKRTPFMGMVFVIGILALAIEISLAVVLSYSDNEKTKIHAKIQTCILGVIFIALGFLIHISLAIAGVIIVAYVLIYFYRYNR